MSLYVDPPHVKLGRAFVALLKTSADLTDFFGPSISLMTMADFENPIRQALLAVIAQPGTEVRAVGGNVAMNVPLVARIYLPYITRATQAIAAPVAPTDIPVSGHAAASFRLTEFGPYGESFAGPAVTSTIGATLALPTKASGSDGFRVWRTPAGLTRYHWAGVARGATWTDVVPDTRLGDELAPDVDLGASLMLAVGRAVFGRDAEILTSEGGAPQAYGFIERKPSLPKIVVDRNLLLYEYAFVNQTKFNPETGDIDLNG